MTKLSDFSGAKLVSVVVKPSGDRHRFILVFEAFTGEKLSLTFATAFDKDELQNGFQKLIGVCCNSINTAESSTAIFWENGTMTFLGK